MAGVPAKKSRSMPRGPATSRKGKRIGSFIIAISVLEQYSILLNGVKHKIMNGGYDYHQYYDSFISVSHVLANSIRRISEEMDHF
jgi:hypothetical protein